MDEAGGKSEVARLMQQIEQGLPIRAEHAQAVRSALQHLTGVSYSALIPLIAADILAMTHISH